VCEGAIGCAHYRLSSFIIITHRSPSRTSGHQRRSTSISDHHRRVAPDGDHVCPPEYNVGVHHQPSSIPSSAAASSGIEAAHLSMAIIMGAPAAPSRRLLVADG
jgi:hypothetical protein